MQSRQQKDHPAHDVPETVVPTDSENQSDLSSRNSGEHLKTSDDQGSCQNDSALTEKPLFPVDDVGEIERPQQQNDHQNNTSETNTDKRPGGCSPECLLSRRSQERVEQSERRKKCIKYLDMLWRIAKVIFDHTVINRAFRKAKTEAQKRRVLKLKLAIVKRKRKILAKKIKTIRHRLFQRPKKSDNTDFTPPDFTP